MCGRARCSLSREELRAEAQVSRWRDEDKYFPSYNSAPGHSTPVVKHNEKDGTLELHTMKWGLVPSYTKAGEKPDFFRMFNARSETVAEKNVFRKLLSRQRCVVLLNGFYEWKKEGKQKQPYFIHQQGREAMRMAGLFDIWHAAGDEPMYSFTILTTDSSEKLQWLHDRMPVILADKAAEDIWLAGEGGMDLKEMGRLCVPYSGEDLHWFPVETAMSNMKNDGPECCKPLKRKAITSFFKPRTEGSSQAAPSVPLKSEQTEPSSQPMCEVKAEPTEGDKAELRAPDAAQLAECDLAIKSGDGALGQHGLTSTPQKRPRQDTTSAGGSEPGQKTATGSPRSAVGSQARNRVPAASPAKNKKAKPSPTVPQKGQITSFFMKNSA